MIYIGVVAHAVLLDLLLGGGGDVGGMLQIGSILLRLVFDDYLSFPQPVFNGSQDELTILVRDHDASATAAFLPRGCGCFRSYRSNAVIKVFLI